MGRNHVEQINRLFSSPRSNGVRSDGVISALKREGHRVTVRPLVDESDLWIGLQRPPISDISSQSSVRDDVPHMGTILVGWPGR